MIKCNNLKKSTINDFYNVNIYREKFNNLNMDFFASYNLSNFAQQLFMRRRVKLLKLNTQIIGHIWYEYKQNGIYSINALNVLKDELNVKNYFALINCIKKYKEVHYECMKNAFNQSILEELGFERQEGIVELHVDVDSLRIDLSHNKRDVEFQVFKKHKDEEKRCIIQNSVFHSDNRIPLTIEDINYDISQSYYIEDAAIFLIKDQQCIGYGQIIIEDNKPYIVNLGIVKDHRGRGYGYSLLTHLLSVSLDLGFKDLHISVVTSNFKAITLYKSVGFNIKNEISKWVLFK